MKRTAWLVLALVGLMFLTPSFASADKRDDLQAIKKAVKENPAYEPGKEVKWFKVLVTDTRTNKETVRITLPIALVEAFMKCSGDKHLRIDHDRCDIDFQELLGELKKVGPMALVEVYDHDEMIKVWLE
jgi:hypothetical protein